MCLASGARSRARNRVPNTLSDTRNVSVEVRVAPNPWILAQGLLKVGKFNAAHDKTLNQI